MPNRSNLIVVSMSCLVVTTIAVIFTLSWQSYAENQLRADCQRDGKVWIAGTCAQLCLFNTRDE